MYKVFLIIFTVVQFLLFNTVWASLVVIEQNSDFKFLYTKYQQESLLYEAESIVERQLRNLGCEDVIARGEIAEEMYDPGFISWLFGERSKSARYRFSIQASCPDYMTVFQTYVSFAFHTSDISTVFYYGYYDDNLRKAEVGVIVDRWGELPKKEDFKSYKHCNGDWNDEQFNLLQEFFCK